jgi:flavodoxin
MKPRILVLYYTQSGQLKDILDSILSEVKDKAEIDYARIEPVTPFPFPWPVYTFFDTMPETVQQIPVDIKPLPADITNKQYDLVLFGYQPWFLHPSIPVSSFLQSEQANSLKGKNVVTVIGCRNMWLNAQERVKEHFERIGVNLVGNIVLNDTNPNLVSVLTIDRWVLKGKKEASGLLPAAGVQDKDIKAAARFGPIIYEHIVNNTLHHLQHALLSYKCLKLNPGLVILETRGVKNFRFWSKYMREKGGPGDANRKGRVTAFRRLLFVAIYILSPISSLTAVIQKQVQKQKLNGAVDYFKGVGFENGRI